MSSANFEKYLTNKVLDCMPDIIQQVMPSGNYQTFYLWAISEENPKQYQFLECIGFYQIVKVLIHTVEGYVHHRDWDILGEYMSPLTAYLMFEVVSDNIAIGLGLSPQGYDKTYSTRIQILREFNTIMIGRLVGSINDTEKALSPIRPLINRISLYKQSITAEKQNISVQLYVEHNPELSAHQLEYSAWDLLVANIESACNLLVQVQETQIFELFNEGLVRRYHSVNRLLESIPAGLQDYVYTGADTILVTPSFSYMLGVVYELLTSNVPYSDLVREGVMAEALNKAATLIRLQNDIGTNLLDMSNTKRYNYLMALAEDYPEIEQDAHYIFNFVLAAGADHPVLSRLHKDIEFGEFNVALQQIPPNLTPTDALVHFVSVINSLADMYYDEYRWLQELADTIAEYTGSTGVSDLLLRVVQFHASLYSNSYLTQTGEYAI